MTHHWQSSLGDSNLWSESDIRIAYIHASAYSTARLVILLDATLYTTLNTTNYSSNQRSFASLNPSRRPVDLGSRYGLSPRLTDRVPVLLISSRSWVAAWNVERLSQIAREFASHRNRTWRSWFYSSASSFRWGEGRDIRMKCDQTGIPVKHHFHPWSSHWRSWWILGWRIDLSIQ